MPLLKIEDLKVGIGTNINKNSLLINGIDLEINSGEIVALVGESGSGKSLTAMAIMGLLPRGVQVQGKIIYKDKNILNLSENQIGSMRGKEIAMIFQEPLAALNPLHNIACQISESLRSNNKSKQEANNITLQLLKNIGLNDEIAQKYPHQLSGGQRQRVLIAMMTANKPHLLIADEPSTALDASSRLKILGLLRNLCLKNNTSLLLITHDINMVKSFAAKIYVMHKGEILETGKTSKVLNIPKHDWTKKLLAACKLGKPTPSKKSIAILKIKSLQVNYPIRKGVFKRIKGYTHALAKTDFELQKGETLGILGESGSGKSSLGMAVLRLLKKDEWQGKIDFLQGDNLAKPRYITLSKLQAQELRSIRPQMQMIFQDPYSSLNPRLTVGQSIAEGLQFVYKVSAPKREQIIHCVMDEVNLNREFIFAYPNELSGGQRQRVAIARSLVMEPYLLILDEPTSSLDATAQLEIVNLLRSLQKRRKLSYIFITHDIGLTYALSHKVLILKEGKVITKGETKKILTKPSSNYVKELLRAYNY